MPQLLHEYWAELDGGTLAVVTEQGDLLRPKVWPNAKLVHSFMASSWTEAQTIHYEMLSLGEYQPHPADRVYTMDDHAVQVTYLARRKL